MATVYRGLRQAASEVVGVVDSEGDLYLGHDLGYRIGHIDRSGEVFKRGTWSMSQIGFVDGLGEVGRGTRSGTHRRLGYVDGQGNVFSGSRFGTHSQIGYVDGSGEMERKAAGALLLLFE